MNIRLLDGERLKYAMQMVSQCPVDGSYEMVLRKVKSKRSLAINRLYWMWLSEIANGYEESHGEMFSSDTWHQYFKRLFLGQEPVEINGNHFVRMKSTTKLSNKDMVDYMERIELWAGKELELQLSHPDDMWAEAMGC